MKARARIILNRTTGVVLTGLLILATHGAEGQGAGGQGQPVIVANTAAQAVPVNLLPGPYGQPLPVARPADLANHLFQEEITVNLPAGAVEGQGTLHIPDGAVLVTSTFAETVRQNGRGNRTDGFKEQGTLIRLLCDGGTGLAQQSEVDVAMPDYGPGVIRLPDGGTSVLPAVQRAEEFARRFECLVTRTNGSRSETVQVSVSGYLLPAVQ